MTLLWTLKRGIMSVSKTCVCVCVCVCISKHIHTYVFIYIWYIYIYMEYRREIMSVSKTYIYILKIYVYINMRYIYSWHLIINIVKTFVYFRIIFYPPLNDKNLDIHFHEQRWNISLTPFLQAMYFLRNLRFMGVYIFLDASMACGSSQPRDQTAPQQQPELLQWQCQILNLLRHKRTFMVVYFDSNFFSLTDNTSTTKCMDFSHILSNSPFFCKLQFGVLQFNLTLILTTWS